MTVMNGYEITDAEALRLAERFFFRRLHPLLSLGTASDRYKGWLGQIYTEELYHGRITGRAKRVGKKGFREEVLPVDSVREYFQHFKTLEIDYTFYAPLIENGAPTACHNTLRQYSTHLGPEDRVFLKAPRVFFARKLLRGNGYVPNENYLAAQPFISQFYKPARDLLGPNLKGIIFEQEYQRQSERAPAEKLAAGLDAFFSAIPPGIGRHVELRTQSYSCKPVRDVFEKHGVGQILSHWTWLPGLSAQFAKAGNRFITAGGEAVVRLIGRRALRGRLCEGLSLRPDRRGHGATGDGSADCRADARGYRKKRRAQHHYKQPRCRKCPVAGSNNYQGVPAAKKLKNHGSLLQKSTLCEFIHKAIGNLFIYPGFSGIDS